MTAGEHEGLQAVTDQLAISFGKLLRQLRAGARLTQEELAEAAGLSPRSVSDLERGVNRTARKETALLLGDALGLTGQVRTLFVAAARGRASVGQVLTAWQGTAADATGDHVGTAGTLSPGLAAPQVRYSLPADTAAFTGRGGELSQITAVAGQAARAGGAVAVGAVDGMPGVGKTALTIHVAHSLTSEFPDRQLFIDLHGHTPGQEPVRPEDALAGLLAAVGVDPKYLPGDLSGRSALWRDRMTRQRALLVFDNAGSSDQVAPLLPGGDGCLVLVTSRRHLGDLPGAVTSLLVGVLPPSEAADMFTQLAPRAAGERDVIGEVVRLAGFLPLAISLLARVYARHPSWTLADLVAETRAGVLTLAAEDDSVAAAFEVSYRHLDPASRRLFRLLGVHPGAAIDGHAAGALAGISLADAAGLLDGLHREGLVTEVGYRRYGMHDLLRRYARDLAAAADPAESEQALTRLLDYYQHVAVLADRCLARLTRPAPVPPAPAGCEVPELGDAGQALAWARADHANLLACLDLAERTGQHARLVALTAGLAALFRHDGPLAEAAARHAAAASAARHLGDRPGEADALNSLGTVRQMMSDYPGMVQALEQALGIFRDLGDRPGEANALNNLGTVRRLTGDYPGAAGLLEQALGIFRDLGDRLGEANVLQRLGIVRRLTGDYPGAAGLLEQALSIFRDLGNRLGEANSLQRLGSVRYLTGDYPGAAQTLEQALGIYRNLGNRFGEANALHELGTVRRLTGDYAGAARASEQALGICRDLGIRHSAANALSNLGIVRRLTGDYPGAAGLLEQALSIFRDLSDQQGQAETLNEQGTLHWARGDVAQAQECHEQALDLACLIGSAYDEALALVGLGRCAITVGNAIQADALLRQAHGIFQRIGAAEARDVLAELDVLTRAGSTS